MNVPPLRAIRSVPLAVLLACAEGGGPGGLPGITDVSFFTDDAFGAALVTDFGPVTVRAVERGTTAFAAVEGSDDVRLFDFPVSERLLRVGRVGEGAPVEPESEITFDLPAVCAPRGCAADDASLRAVAARVRATGDGGVVAMMVVEARENWSSLFLTRFEADGTVRWTHELPDVYSEAATALAERADGGFVVAWRYEPDPETSRHVDRGTALLHVAPDGTAERTPYLRAGSVDDAGHGLPAEVAPWVNAVLPLADGDLLVGGFLAFSRYIQCGSYDEPRPPSSLVCSDYTSEGFVARLSASGEVRWQRELGEGFVGERSSIVGLLGDPDGDLTAVGSIAMEPGHSPDPVEAGLVVGLTAEGEVSSRVRVSPGAVTTDGGAVVSLPLPGPDGALDFLHARGPHDVWALRMLRDGEIAAVRRLPSGNTDQPTLTHAEVVGSNWVVLESWTREARQGWRHALAP